MKSEQADSLRKVLAESKSKKWIPKWQNIQIISAKFKRKLNKSRKYFVLFASKKLLGLPYFRKHSIAVRRMPKQLSGVPFTSILIVMAGGNPITSLHLIE
jgi:hypothetical protein